MEQPYTLSDYFTRYLLSPTAWQPQEKLTEVARECRSLLDPATPSGDIDADTYGLQCCRRKTF